MLEHANGSEMIIGAHNKTNVSFTFHKTTSKPTDLTPNSRNEQYNSANTPPEVLFQTKFVQKPTTETKAWLLS